MDFEDEMDFEEERLLRLPEVLRLTGLGRSTVYAWIKAGRFISRRKIGHRAVGFRAGDLFEWLQARAIVDDEDLQKES